VLLSGFIEFSYMDTTQANHKKKKEVQIEESWKAVLNTEFEKPYFANIKKSLMDDKQKGIAIYPAGPLVFNAFNTTSFNNVKVVILGQDPYHGKGQAHGLSFSVPEGIKAPPSLKNIFKEIQSDLNIEPPEHGNLTTWAKQGVFLLNAMLTVRASQPASHQKIGWQNFTNAVINTLSDKREGLVFMLWGRFAQNKSELIDHTKHLVLKAAHPSPFSAHNGFFGCQHFSKANTYLKAQGLDEIKWDLKV